MSLPYFPMYPTDFEADAGWLSLAEDGAFNRLLRLCWLTPSCTIPNDDAWIRRRLKVSQEEYDTIVKPVLNDFFKVVRGRYVNARLLKEYREANAKHKRRSKAGKKGGKSKALKTNKSDASDAKAMPKQPEPEPEPEPIVKDIYTNARGNLKPDMPSKAFVQAVQARWNSMAASNRGMPRLEMMTSVRLGWVRHRLADVEGREEAVMRAIDNVPNDPHRLGKSGNGDWRADFDWVFKDSQNFLKCLESQPVDQTPKAQHDRTNQNRNHDTKTNHIGRAARIALEGLGSANG